MQKFAFSIVLILLHLTVHSQEAIDSAAIAEDKGFLLTNLSYTSNNNSSRLVNAIKMPALMANMAYYSNFGLSVSGDYFKYLAPDTNTFEAEFGIAYEKSFLDRFDVEGSYTNRYFKGDDAYEGISYKHALGLSGSYRLKNLTATLDNTFMIGRTRNYFLDLSLSYDFKFDQFIFRSGYLAISPTLIGSLGTTYWIPGTIDNTWGNHGNGMHPGLYVPDRDFAYQNMSLILPVQYTLGSFTLSSGWFYAIPSRTLKKEGWNNQSGFLVSLSYVVIF